MILDCDVERIRQIGEIASAINRRAAAERARREFWDGIALFLACLVFGPCYVIMVFAFFG